MPQDLNDLASRFKAALEEEEQARGRREDLARQARDELLSQLRAFADAIGVIEVQQGEARLVLGFRGRSVEVRHTPDDGVLALEYAGARGDETLRLGADGTWSWDRASGATPLLEGGLEDLMVEALGLPRLGAAEPRPAERRPAPAPAPAPEKEPAPARAAPASPKAQKTEGDYAHLGRSGTRAVKRAKDVPPGAAIKPFKGPGPT